MLSDSPPERDVIWTEAGAEGAHRFVQRVWRLISEAAPALQSVTGAPALEGDAATISKTAHRTVKAVGEDIEKLAFNKAIARLYELVNVLAVPLQKIAAGDADAATISACREATDMLIAMIAPMMPHLAEECWKALNGAGLVADRAWPHYNDALIVENTVTMPVQINGKKRGDLTIARDADQLTVEKAALELDFVKVALNGNPPKKVIVVPQRIINVVA
ncbi:class I tRNA ligase family protein [Phyllobacterium meliloti]|nr:class I tRNA ligase family protein [Phyllobacterium sp. T1293]